MIRQLIREYIALDRHDARIGHGYGSIKPTTFTDTPAGKREQTFPYGEPDVDEEDLELVDLDPDVSDKLSTKLGTNHVSSDVHAQTRIDHRHFAGTDTQFPPMGEGIGRSTPHKEKVDMTYPTLKAGQQGIRRGPFGGTVNAVINKTGPYKRTGHIRGTSHPHQIYGDSESYHIWDIHDDMLYPEELSLLRAEENVDKIKDINSKEDVLFDYDDSDDGN